MRIDRRDGRRPSFHDEVRAASGHANGRKRRRSIAMSRKFLLLVFVQICAVCAVHAEGTVADLDTALGVVSGDGRYFGGFLGYTEDGRKKA